jgi:hypothetical protein
MNEDDDDIAPTGIIARWIDWLEDIQAAEVEGGGEALDTAELLANGLAQVESFAETLAGAEAARRKAAIGILTRAFVGLRQKAANDRATLLAENARLSRRVDALARDLAEAAESNAATTTELRQRLAEAERSAARDRSLRRLEAGRRSYPHADKARLEAARRKTDRAIAIGGRSGMNRSSVVSSRSAQGARSRRAPPNRRLRLAGRRGRRRSPTASTRSTSC